MCYVGLDAALRGLMVCIILQVIDLGKANNQGVVRSGLSNVTSSNTIKIFENAGRRVKRASRKSDNRF